MGKLREEIHKHSLVPVSVSYEMSRHRASMGMLFCVGWAYHPAVTLRKREEMMERQARPASF